MKLRDNIEHRANPLHLMCRLTKLGLDIHKSRKIVRIYEVCIFIIIKGGKGYE